MRSMPAILCVLLFLLTPIGAIAVPGDGPAQMSGSPAVSELEGGALEVRVPLTFGNVWWVADGHYAVPNMDGTTGQWSEPGEPVVPMWNDMFVLPVGSDVIDVRLEGRSYYGMQGVPRVQPGPEPIMLIEGAQPKPLYEGDAYGSDALYPADEMRWRVTTGYGEWREIEAHISVTVMPFRYDPVHGEAVVLESAELVISYIPGPGMDAYRPRDSNESYDILALAPTDYVNETLRYEEHKEGLGFTVRTVDLFDVYNGSFFNVSHGVDDQEKIKYFIAYAVVNWSVKYVLLVGDNGVFPVRVARINDGCSDGPNVATDLYFGDLFERGTLTFDDWNSDGDSYYAEAGSGVGNNADDVDLDPDVAVGRYPVSSVEELGKVINKTISYQENVTNGGWFLNMTLVASDTFAGDGSGIAEGEYTLDIDANVMGSEFTYSRFYETLGNFNRNNIEANMNQGEGFASWANHGSTSGVVYPSTGGGPGISTTVANRLTNGHKLPLSLQDACQTSFFDAGSDALGEILVTNPDGGAIGTIGATRIAWGAHGTWHAEWNSGLLDINTHKAYAEDGYIMPATMLDSAKRNYLIKANYNPDYIDLKTLVQYVYLGDPAVMLGGPGIDLGDSTVTVYGEPGETIVHNITVANVAPHYDELDINITGGAWNYVLGNSTLDMDGNTSMNISLAYVVPQHIKAYVNDSVVVNVLPRSTLLPVRQTIVTIVKPVRDLAVDVPVTEFTAGPGEQVDVGYDIVNKGNVIEYLDLRLTGHGDWDPDMARSTSVPEWNTVPGSLVFDVPEQCAPGDFLFTLGITSQGGFSANHTITVTVPLLPGLTASLDRDTGVLDDMNATSFVLDVSNSGNSADSYSVSLDGLPTEWTSELPATMDIDAYSGTSEDVRLLAPAKARAGPYPMTLTVVCEGDPTMHVDLPFTVQMPERTGLEADAGSSERSVASGEEMLIELNVASLSNFDESVTVGLTGLPTDWGLTNDFPGPWQLPAYSQHDVELGVTPADPVKAGSYDATIRVTGKRSEVVIPLTFIVPEVSGLVVSIEPTSLTLIAGEEADAELTVMNPGNMDETYVLTAVTPSGIGIDLWKQWMEVPAFASDKVPLTVSVKKGTKDAGYDITINVASEDGTSEASAGLEVTVLPPPFAPRHDVDVSGGGKVELDPGSSGSFTITLDNTGNVAETVTVLLGEVNGYGGTTEAWDVRHDPSVQLAPGGNMSLVVSFTVPTDVGDGDTYVIVIELASGTDAWNVRYQVHVPMKVLPPPPPPVDQGGEGTESSAFAPFHLPLAIVVALIVAVLVLKMAMGRRRKR